MFSVPLAGMVTRRVYGWDLAEGVTGLPETLAPLADRPSVRQLSAESQAGMEAFRARMQAR